jgi:hypothetical protein
MMAIWNEIYPWLIAGIGGFIGAALLLPTKLGEALVQFRVGKALEAFKAQQTGELERLREQLSHLGDRGRRSNEMEFAAIETVWRAFVKAWLSTNTCGRNEIGHVGSISQTGPGCGCNKRLLGRGPVAETPMPLQVPSRPLHLHRLRH